MSGVALVGCIDTAKEQLNKIMENIKIDEIMVNSFIYDKEAQYKSYKLLAEMINEKF